MEQFRRTIFKKSETIEVATVTNRNGWMFSEVHPQFTMALLTIKKGEPSETSIALRGPFASRAAWEEGLQRRPHRFGAEEVLGWTSSASLPLLPSEESVGVFVQMRRAPRLDQKVQGQWRARPDTELHATGDKHLMVFNPRSHEKLWPVMKGESFDIWENDLGPESYYAWIDPTKAKREIQAKRIRSQKSRRDSGHAEFSLAHVRNLETLPCNAARVAFRDVSRATDTRTVRAALVPPNVFLAHQAPYFLGLREVVWAFLATSERWEHACEHLDPR